MPKKIFLIIAVMVAGFLFLIGQTGVNGDAKLGKVIFEKNCSSCHGKKGQGLGPATRMPNFTDKRYQDSKTNREIFDRISKGGQGTGMPAWERSLSLEERWNLVAYIRTLAR